LVVIDASISVIKSDEHSLRAELDSVLVTRLPKHKVPTAREKCHATLEDIIKACLDPTNELPAYFAVDLNRLPPVDAKPCDVTAILTELQSLRAEVREIGHQRQEVEELKAELVKVKNSKTSSPTVVSINHIGNGYDSDMVNNVLLQLCIKITKITVNYRVLWKN